MAQKIKHRYDAESGYICGVKTATTALPVMEQFDTVQGEGAYTGQAAYFIRLGGCDVGCPWCDVKESWDAEAHQLTEISDLKIRAKESYAEIVVITGGEPLLYELTELTSELQNAGKRTHIETSGAHPTSGSWDWYCLSPKKFKPALPDSYEAADELKIIIFNKHDFAWAEEHAARVSPTCKLYLQPEWSKRNDMIPLITDYVMKNPKWSISLQTHKYLGIP